MLSGKRCAECANFRTEHRIALDYYAAVVASLGQLAYSSRFGLPEYEYLKIEAEEARLGCQRIRKAYRAHVDDCHGVAKAAAGLGHFGHR